MATGGASQLARLTALRPLAVPLLWLTVAELVAIPALGLLRRRPAGAAALRPVRLVRPVRPLRAVPAERLFGDFTVPLGLAVTGTGLAGLGTGAALAGALCAVILAWVLTLAMAARVGMPVAARLPVVVAALDGTWFLAPAALLADAIGTVAVTARLPAPARPALGWLALAGCGLGVAGYGLALALAAVRVRQAGVRDAARAPWWISAGCGGLAAASVGQLAGVTPAGPGSAAAARAFAAAALVSWAAGTAVLVPVVIGSLAYLRRRRRAGGPPPWPPTFSTGVYALGADQAGRLAHVQAISALGRAAGLATVALWFATSGLYLAYLSRRGRRLRPPAPAADPHAAGTRRRSRSGLG